MTKDIMKKRSTVCGQPGTSPLATTPHTIQKKHRQEKNPVKKRMLSNGMTVLVRPVHMIPKVSIQLWYDVGSRDEKDKERGIAHLIEHMIFKGTDIRSESDINTVTHMLSGSCNAFTSYDFTGYLFDFPTQHWQEALATMADCMSNVSFKDDMLNSEMKAVIQELKMYKDRYMRSLIDEMTSIIFADHPYHHPIIGYKQDLWSVSADNLRNFYKKHYAPNNATLIVVGDVDEEEVFALAQSYFGSIPASKGYAKDEPYFNQDIAAKSIILYRDIKQPLVTVAFIVPGTRAKKDHILSLIEWIIGKGKGSHLYKKLVNELQLVTSLSASHEELFDYGLFFISYEPKNEDDIPLIQSHIQQEIESLIAKGVDEQELSRAVKQTQMALYSLLEDTESQAFEIGKFYLATKDENYLFNYLDQPLPELRSQLHALLAAYFRSAVMHTGMVLPLSEQEKPFWAQLQAQSDQEDERILAARPRTTAIEPPSYAQTVEVKEAAPFSFPKPQTFTTANGLKVFFYDNKNTPKIDIIIDLKAKYFYDPEDKQGLYQFVSKMLLEGTKKYTAQQLIDAIESRGMSISCSPGAIAISLLSEDLEFGLGIVDEIVSHPTFPEREIEKVRDQLLARLKSFWDDPRYFAGQLAKEVVYKGHPYSKNSIGTVDAVKLITRQDLIDFYKKYITPQGAKIAIVGDLKSYNLPTMLEKTVGNWQGQKVAEIAFPSLAPIKSGTIDYPINRDQIVLRFTGLSVSRLDPNYDKLLLFDQIFGGGILGSMSSRLFDLREQSGLFYTISGSLIAGSDEQPGTLTVQTIVSLDRLEEAERVIKETIDTVASSITDEELIEAKNAIVNTLVDNFASNYSIAGAFLFLDRYKFPASFFDNRAATLGKVDRTQMCKAAQEILQTPLLTLRIGRIAQAVTKKK